jgi:CRP/FNR family transcriptional regulator
MTGLLCDLQSIQLFAGLSEAARQELATLGGVRSYGDGQVIMLEGDTESPVFFVLQGTVRVFRTNLDGREQTLIHLGPGAALNMPAAFLDRPGAPASVLAVGPVKLFSISGQDFRRLVSGAPEIALAVLGDFSSKLVHLTDLTYDLGLRSVRARLARFLLAHIEAGQASPVRWTHEQMAAQIGTVREVVSRTLRAFVRDGLVKVQRHRIVVLDRDALAREAES